MRDLLVLIGLVLMTSVIVPSMERLEAQADTRIERLQSLGK